MHNFFEPSLEDCTIVFHRKDRSTVNIDIIELNELTKRARDDARNAGADPDMYMSYLIPKFEEVYEAKLTKSAMMLLVMQSTAMWERLKKSCYQSPEPTDTAESNSQQTTEVS